MQNIVNGQWFESTLDLQLQNSSLILYSMFFTDRVVGKVMFLLMFVRIPSCTWAEGVYPSMHLSRRGVYPIMHLGRRCGWGECEEGV